MSDRLDKEWAEMTQLNQCPYDEGAVCVDAPNAPEDCWENRDKRDERCQSHTIYHLRAELAVLRRGVKAIALACLIDEIRKRLLALLAQGGGE